MCWRQVSLKEDTRFTFLFSNVDISPRSLYLGLFLQSNPALSVSWQSRVAWSSRKWEKNESPCFKERISVSCKRKRSWNRGTDTSTLGCCYGESVSVSQKGGPGRILFFRRPFTVHSFLSCNCPSRPCCFFIFGAWWKWKWASYNPCKCFWTTSK